MFALIYAEGVPWNETYWSHDRFNELLILARSELDENLRREMYFEMQQIVSDEGGIIIPMFAAYVGAYSDALVKPDQVASNWRNDGHRSANAGGSPDLTRLAPERSPRPRPEAFSCNWHELIDVTARRATPTESSWAKSRLRGCRSGIFART